MERRKDQKNDLTLKEYQSLTGKNYPAHIIKDKQGREYVSWDNAVDNFATEYGYETPEALYNDLEKLVIARQDAEGYQEVTKMAATDANNTERSIKLLKRVKEGKYDIKASTEESGESTPETSKPIPVNQQTGKQGTADTAGSGTAGGNKAASELTIGTVQTGLNGFGKTSAQADMLGEFSGKTGAKPGLVDVEALEKREASKPLPGQIKFNEGTENAAVKEVKEMFDKAEATGAIVRTTSGHWKQVDGTWRFFRDINPGSKLKGLSPTTSRMSMYLSTVKPSAAHHAIPKATKPHVIPQHRTKDGRGLTRRSDR